jgi:hypothetical protein
MLVESSLVFIINASSTDHPIYCLLFLGLTLTSIFFHSYGAFPYLDKLMILGIVLYGGSLLKYNAELPLILATFIIACILYGYGYCVNDYCFHPVDGESWHACLHVVSCIGHLLIAKN